MNNAYDLRYSNYRYMRGKSALITKCEELFEDGVLVPNGMAALSLVLQYYKPKGIWYPEELYRETQNLIKFMGISYNSENPDMVIIDYPSFRGERYKNPFPNALLVIDNSINPLEQPECDILITSLSKHYVNCETVLGLIKFNTHKEDCENMKLLRCASGYAVFDFQCEALLRNFDNFKNLMQSTLENAKSLHKLLDGCGIENVLSGSIVFIMVNKEPREIALKTPFELRPTYGCSRTFCSYSFYEEDLVYFGKPYIRVSVGVDYTPEELFKIIKGVL